MDDYFARLEARFAADPLADHFEDWTLTVLSARLPPAKPQVERRKARPWIRLNP